jgi:hypothetical protein
VGKFDLDDLMGRFDRKKSADSTPHPSPEDEAGMFVRQDPEEIPRPPDFTGEGLGTEVHASEAAANLADPTRVRPNDALSEIYRPGDDDELLVHDDLGQLLLDRGIITAEVLANAQRIGKQTPGKRMSQVLIEAGVDEFAVQEAVATLANLPFERINCEDSSAFDGKSLQRLTPDFCKNSLVMPLRTEGSRLVVGTVHPDDVFLLDDVKRRLGVPAIKHVLVTGYDIRGVIEILGAEEAEEYDVDELLADVEEDDVELVEEDLQEADVGEAESSPVVRYVNHIIQTALKEGASDIHVEPDEKTLKVRFRIDGVLFEMMNPPRKMHAAHDEPDQDHGEPGHRRAAFAAGRPHPGDGDGPQAGPACVDRADAEGREGRDAYSRHPFDQRAARRPRLRRGHADDLEEPDRAAARHHPRDGPDGFR